jgi:hypothetical protein
MFSIILLPTLKRASEISQRVFVGLLAKGIWRWPISTRITPTVNIVYVLHPRRNLPARVVTAKSECSEPIVETEQNSPAQRDDRSDYLWLVPHIRRQSE